MATANRPIPPTLRTLPDDGTSRRDRLVEAISSAITTQALPEELPLPSCRALARAHGLSKNTVLSAYERLVEIGLVNVRAKSGFFIAKGSTARRRQEPRADQGIAWALPEPLPSSLVRVRHPEGWRDCPFPFVYNQIDPSLFPLDAWRECSRLALGRRSLTNWTADDERGDHVGFVTQLRKRLLVHRGVLATDDEVLVTAGAQNAIALAGLLVRGKAGVIAVEDPGYPDARNAFTLTGNTVVPVPVDGEGLRVGLLPAGCKLVYVTPSHQFPTSVTLSMSRRRELLAAAERDDFLVLEDDYEADLEPSSSMQTLRSLDRTGRVIYVSSLSKTLSPGLRLGFMVARDEIAREAQALRHAILRHVPTTVQETAALFIGLGHYDAHLRRFMRDLDSRRTAMRLAIAHHLPTLSTNAARGGSAVWVTGPSDLEAGALAQRLQSRGVIIDPGWIFHVAATPPNTFRLGFGLIRPSRMDEGIAIIAEEIARAR